MSIKIGQEIHAAPRRLKPVLRAEVKLPKQPGKPIARRFLTALQYGAIALASLLAAGSQTAGQIMVLLFGIVVIWRKLGSRPVFILALFLLVAIPLFQILQQPVISENLAVYVFELLVIGTIIALFEIKGSEDPTH
jgi:uncharacterized membrane protein